MCSLHTFSRAGRAFSLASGGLLLLALVTAGCDRSAARGADQNDQKTPDHADKKDAHTGPATQPEHAAAKPDDEHEKGVVKLEEYDEERLGLKVAAAVATKHRRETKAFGAIEADPALTFVVRAPLAGVLRAPKEGDWPSVGQKIPAGK